MLLRFLRTPWRVFRLKRRVTAQRGTIIAQRREIAALRLALVSERRHAGNADVLAARRERNKLAGSAAVAAKIQALQDENDQLAELVCELRVKVRA